MTGAEYSKEHLHFNTKVSSESIWKLLIRPKREANTNQTAETIIKSKQLNIVKLFYRNLQTEHILPNWKTIMSKKYMTPNVLHIKQINNVNK